MQESYVGTYIGPISHLRGEEALIEPKSETKVLAQFNNVEAFRRSYRQSQMRPRGLRKHLGYGWHSFPRGHWKVVSLHTGQAAL